MTGQSAGPVRLLLRAPPHLPFLQGWPGILAGGNRNGAAVHGSVEIRLGTQPVKAKYVHVKVVKHETLPSNSVAKGPSQSSTTYIGKVHVLWKAQEGKEWEPLQTADYRFIIPLPADLPPTTESKNAHIRYELVATVCYKGKSGLFKKDNSAISSTSEPLRIIKHELASAWPKYNIVERQSIQAGNGQVVFTVERPSNAFGPGDRIVVTPILRSQGPPAFGLREFVMTLVEVFTVYPAVPDKNAPKSKKNKEPQQPTIKRTTVGSTRVVMKDNVQPGTESSTRMELVVPSDRPLMTVRQALLFSTEYELVVEAVCDGLPSKILISGLPCIIGTFTRSSAQQAVNDIGYVEGLCPRPQGGGHRASPSMPGLSGASPRSQRGGHQHSASASSGLQVPDAYHRPLSMTPAADSEYSPTPQRQSPPLQQYPTLPSRQSPALATAAAPGFVPRQLWRRSSSGTTTTTTTTTTAQTDFAPLPDRNASTLPTRASLAFPTPSPNMNTYSRAADSPLSRDGHSESAPSELGYASQRLSGTTFGGNRSETFQSSTRGSPSPSTPPPKTQSGWPTAEDEKKRLYEAARARAAKSQAAHGADLSHLGLNDVSISEQPPGYAPASSTNTPRVSSPASSAQHGAVLASTPRASPSPAPRTPLSATRYKTAAEEKDEMRRRYEMAQNRVASGSAGASQMSSPVATTSHLRSSSLASYKPDGSSSQTVSSPITYLSAAEEKEQMRRRYEEAQSRVARNAGSINGSPQASSSGHGQSRSVSLSYLSSGDEHDTRPPSHLPSSRVVSSPHSASRSSSSPSYPSAAEEKDLMRRRFEEAERKVNNSVGGPSANGHLHTSSMSSVTASASGGSSQPSSHSAPYLSAAEEKDSMRKRYEEATRKVAPVTNDVPPTAPVAAPAPSAYMSAAEEKDLMRKRYEQAHKRVVSSSMSQGSFSGPASSAGHDNQPPPTEEPIPYDELFGASSGSANTSGPPATKPTTSTYMSAEDEKDLMRRRFEEAENRVKNSTEVAAAASSPRSVTASEQPATHTSGPSSSGYMTAKQEKDAAKQRYEAAQGAVSRTVEDRPGASRTGSGGGSGSGYQPRWSSTPLPDGPPPPLPSRPPAEYINRI